MSIEDTVMLPSESEETDAAPDPEIWNVALAVLLSNILRYGLSTAELDVPSAAPTTAFVVQCVSLSCVDNVSEEPSPLTTVT